MERNRLKRKLQEGHVATIVGDCDTPDAIEHIGSLGIFDSVWLEMEHGATTWSELPDLSRAADITGMSSIVRVRKNDAEIISLTLGLGVDGIIVPHVNSKEDAERVVDAALFSPVGHRGAAGGRKSYGRKDYYEQANDETVIVVLIEDILAVENLDEILEVPHIDVFFVTSFDLAQSMGLLHDVGNPRVKEVRDGAIQQIAAAGRTPGCVIPENDLQQYIEMGVRFTKAAPRKWIEDGARAYAEKLKVAQALPV